jgi:hypothetical protein
MSRNKTNSVSSVRRPRIRSTEATSLERADSKNEKLPVSERIAKGMDTGLNNSARKQHIARRPKASGEKVYRGIKNNAFIVLGNDRPGARSSGYGGLGDHHCDMIDLVAGLGGNEVTEAVNAIEDAVNIALGKTKTTKKRKKKKVYTEPDFKWDAARIYICQKTDIDHNFKLVPGTVGMSVEKSAVALKADAIRIIARDGVKIISSADSYNSQGGKRMTMAGIDLIAGNIDKAPDHDLQPLVRGDNMVMCLQELYQHIADAIGIFHDMMKSQMEYNNAISTHQHISPFFGILVEPSVPLLHAGPLKSMQDVMNTEASVFNQLTNFAGFNGFFLEPSGDKYILSNNNRTN